jgi:hypothetical protein
LPATAGTRTKISRLMGVRITRLMRVMRVTPRSLWVKDWSLCETPVVDLQPDDDEGEQSQAGHAQPGQQVEDHEASKNDGGALRVYAVRQCVLGHVSLHWKRGGGLAPN